MCALVAVILIASSCGAAAELNGNPGATREEIGNKETSATRTGVAPTTAWRPTTTTTTPGLRSSDPNCPGGLDSGSAKGPALGRSPSTTTPTTTVLRSSTTAPPVRPPSSGRPSEGASTGAGSTTSTAVSDARGALDNFKGDPRLAGTKLSVSVWVEGVGEAASESPDALLVPASNQKLVTAMGALALLDPDEHLDTYLVATGPIVDGILSGDLILVGGGDPTLRASAAPNSLESLAQAAADRGLRQVQGRLVVDESRYDSVRVGPSWPGDWLWSVGPLSALGVDHNMLTKEASFVDDPARGNGEAMRFALAAKGVQVDGGVDVGRAGPGVEVARVESPPLKTLVATMLQYSDNFIAEMLLKEIAFRQTGQPGSTKTGAEAVHRLISTLCVPVSSVDADGSGLSRDDRRSAREFRRLLQAAELQPWGELFVSGLSISGEDDALGGRLTGSVTAGRVRAKGGFLFVSRSLSGYMRTVSGSRVVFSVLVNGSLQQADHKVEDAIDDLLTSIASLPR